MSKTSGSPPVVVTLAEIARLAGVGRAAVSNWRRRYDSFPSPVGGTDTSPQFSLPQVEEWLRRENKLKTALNPLDRLWPEYESLGDRETTGLLVARVGLRQSGVETAGPAGGPRLDQRQTRLLERTLELAQPDEEAKTFELLLDRWLRTHVRQITTTPVQLAQLMAQAAAMNHPGPVRSVLDPACGTGTLLIAAGRQWDAGRATRLRFLGQDSDPVLVELAKARLSVDGFAERDLSNVSLAAGDTLRGDAHLGTQADVILSNPPSNERDWGHAELATDPRWVYGQPPRTEPELAWVQHAAAALAPGGVAVLVLPPAVAARRAGRRIRAGLLRSGVLRTVIALPPGVAPPYGVGLHLWILHADGVPGRGGADGRELTFVDTTHATRPVSVDSAGVDWSAVAEQVVGVLGGTSMLGSVSVPVVDLLDDQVDLTPARRVPRTRAATIVDLRRLWTRFDSHMGEVREAADALSALIPADGDETVPLISVGELERAGALEIRTGQGLPESLVRRGERQEDETRVLTGTPLSGQAQLWLPASAVAAGEQDGSLTVTAPQDVIVSVLARAFDVRVESDAPSVLGPQLSALRVNPAVLDPWFLSGCLRAPANVHRAGTHASTTSRIDVRRLHVPRLSLEEQRQYGEVYRKIAVFERELTDMKTVGGELSRALGDLLAAGHLPRD
ncbi:MULTISPECIES: HsdM family class I SAM-dependent methyltransferase [Streptomyces]|uniref:Class I SAM-dependent DNA methyltransferase n=1 Tax=Streptomyces eurythermus TaxID=42237 RepID=A0ABW6Z734_9ACTN|nr:MULTISPECIES: N-6 DNA methylase [Streptomyces]QIS70811.1 N-6 DNA methylase [Streptomyces sp. DSM 40868]